MKWWMIVCAMLCLATCGVQAAMADLVGQGRVPFMVEPATGRAFYVNRPTRVLRLRRHGHLRYRALNVRVHK